MTGGVGKRPRPAANRGQTRYARREVNAEPSQAKLAPGKLPQAKLPPAKLAQAEPPPAKLAQARLRRAELPQAKLPQAKLPQAELVQAKPPRAKLPRAMPAPAMSAQAVPARQRRGFLSWRRSNRRITVENHSPLVWIGHVFATLARRLLFVGKVLSALVALALAAYGVRWGCTHVIASPHFALREIRVGATLHVDRDEIVSRSGVSLGDRLLTLDTDQIAARLARHPWIAAARVGRQLPATLVIDVTERHAAAVAVIGGLYLIDDNGHPFKHATLEEADGQIVLTGVSRPEYAALPGASEAAFREALALLAAYQHPDSLAAASLATGQNGGSGVIRPPLSEVHIDPHAGFSLFLYDGGGEIRLGRQGITDKLPRLDEILAELGPRGIAALRVIHLDGPTSDRVPIRMAPMAQPAPPTPPPASKIAPKTKK